MSNTGFNKQLQSFLGFFKELLSVHGRSLLVLLIGVYVPLQVFGLLALEVRENEGGFPWDLSILVTVHSTAQPQLDKLAVILTKFGAFEIVFPVVLVIGLVFLLLKRWRSLTYLLITVAGSNTISHTAKEFFHRVRPHFWESPAPELSYAFPSGHATTSMTLVAVLIILAWQTSWRWLLMMFGGLFVLAIAWTRLYLGVHFPSDILGGWLMSIAWSISVSLILRPQLLQTVTVGEATPSEETTLLSEETQAEI